MPPSFVSPEISFVGKAILEQKHYFHRENNREIVMFYTFNIIHQMPKIYHTNCDCYYHLSVILWSIQIAILRRIQPHHKKKVTMRKV
jgi:hypothetical protein